MNIIPELCELLGVEVEEEFYLADLKDGHLHICQKQPTKYRFSNERVFEYFLPSSNKWSVTTAFFGILTGECKIIKLPFEPKDGEFYATIRCIADALVVCERVFRYNELTCWADKYSGNCFRTVADAEPEKYAVFENLTGRKWEDRNEDSVCGASVPG